MELEKITLMEAYLIETLRSKGISNEEILAQVEQGNVEVWQELHKNFDFNDLLTFANQDVEAFKSILKNGYKVKYLTFNGLENLIKLRFGKVKDKDFQLTETGITDLKLTEEQADTLKQMLSQNWTFSLDSGLVSVTHR